MKPGYRKIVGKRITGLVAKEGRIPRQLFLLFDDDTYLEFYGESMDVRRDGGNRSPRNAGGPSPWIAPEDALAVRGCIILASSATDSSVSLDLSGGARLLIVGRQFTCCRDVDSEATSAARSYMADVQTIVLDTPPLTERSPKRTMEPGDALESLWTHFRENLHVLPVLGKRVAGIIAKEGEHSPRRQLFLVFDGDTTLEFYGERMEVTVSDAELVQQAGRETIGWRTRPHLGPGPSPWITQSASVVLGGEVLAADLFRVDRHSAATSWVTFGFPSDQLVRLSLEGEFSASKNLRQGGVDWARKYMSPESRIVLDCAEQRELPDDDLLSLIEPGQLSTDHSNENPSAAECQAAPSEAEQVGPALARKASGMGLNWLWFAPFCLWFAFYYWFPAVRADLYLARQVIKEWVWGVLLSPAAYVCWSVALSLIFLPLRTVPSVPSFFARDSPEFARRYAVSFSILFCTIVFMYIAPLVLWGSFPLIVGPGGHERLRFIPFLPWPHGFEQFFGLR